MVCKPILVFSLSQAEQLIRSCYRVIEHRLSYTNVEVEILIHGFVTYNVRNIKFHTFKKKHALS